MPVLAPTAPSLSNHREQVIWTRLRLGHTRLTHRHLLLGEPPPYCEKFLLERTGSRRFIRTSLHFSYHAAIASRSHSPHSDISHQLSHGGAPLCLL
ncbi:hypothetical protein TNCV_222661 [Trichonephila clavipes]|nr:hypothetical protein TNCV_222661 [Trichonephila clavipes]